METRRTTGARSLRAVALTAAFVVVAAARAACGGGSGTGGGSIADTSSPSPQAAVYTASDSGTTVKALVGERFTIRLAENPSTGYKWAMKLGPGLKLVSGSFEQPSPSPSPPVVGAGGMHVWLVEVETPGTLSVNGAYYRPWEGADKSAAHFTLTVQAQ